ncbi:hypothetical protein L204_104300 [Cryptococcus depauperatus]|nr:hypothetical protein L204_04875 [Cryptococcus depauperatus CBS 7855]
MYTILRSRTFPELRACDRTLSHKDSTWTAKHPNTQTKDSPLSSDTALPADGLYLWRSDQHRSIVSMVHVPRMVKSARPITKDRHRARLPSHALCLSDLSPILFSVASHSFLPLTFCVNGSENSWTRRRWPLTVRFATVHGLKTSQASLAWVFSFSPVTRPNIVMRIPRGITNLSLGGDYLDPSTTTGFAASYGPFYLGDHCISTLNPPRDDSLYPGKNPIDIFVPVSTNQSAPGPVEQPVGDPQDKTLYAVLPQNFEDGDWNPGGGNDSTGASHSEIKSPVISVGDVHYFVAHYGYNPLPGVPQENPPSGSSSIWCSTNGQHGRNGVMDLSTFESYSRRGPPESMDTSDGEPPPPYTATATETPALPPRPATKRSTVGSLFTGLFQPSRYGESTGDTAISRGPKGDGASGSKRASGVGWLRHAMNRANGYSQLSSDVPSRKGTNKSSIFGNYGLQSIISRRLGALSWKPHLSRNRFLSIGN